MSVAVEIAIQDVEGLVVAAHAGADRVELCTDLDAGGSTPPVELVRACADRLAALVAARDAKPHLSLHTLVRLPGGTADFLDDPVQFAVDAAQVEHLAEDAAAMIEAGADGVVIGALARDAGGAWGLDVPAMEAVRDAALTAASRALRSVEITCHRALDALPDVAARVRAVEALVPLGFHRALTSGGAARAVDALASLAAMAEAADGLVEICAGGGVRPADIDALVREGRADSVHLSARLPGAAGAPTSGAPSTQTDAAVATAAVDAAGAL